MRWMEQPQSTVGIDGPYRGFRVKRPTIEPNTGSDELCL
jgi:hypothetical protein